jgi:hypothetical protein
VAGRDKDSSGFITASEISRDRPEEAGGHPDACQKAEGTLPARLGLAIAKTVYSFSRKLGFVQSISGQTLMAKKKLT